MPKLQDLYAMFEDSEFQTFVQGLFKEGEGANNKEGGDMVQNLKKDFTDFLGNNKENPQLKETFDKMMKDM